MTGGTVTPPAHDGPVNEVKYHHVGTGVTPSLHWCAVCDGWYGIPHIADTHDHHAHIDCACAACQQHFGIYPNQGVTVTHVEYLEKIAEAERLAGHA